MLRTLIALGFAFLALTPPVDAQTPRLDRLERLASYLETGVKPRAFDIASWGNCLNPDDPNYVGCSAGHGVALFRADGLNLRQVDGHPKVAYRDEIGLKACREFFGVGVKDADLLFSTSGGAGHDPTRAAANIRKVVARHRVALTLALPP